MPELKMLPLVCFDILFPPRCPFCDEPSPMGEGLPCPECRKNIPYVGRDYCLRCGKAVKSDEEYCSDCRIHRHVFVQSRALLNYTDEVRHSIYRMKYGGRREYADVFGKMAHETLGDWIKSIEPDCIIPVPLHKSRQRKRGYNQAALIAKSLGAHAGIPVREDIVIRARKTRPQKQLDHQERQKNCKKAFKIRQNDVKLKAVLLVDDIYTTGTTLDAVTQTLIDGGVKEVYGLTVSVGMS